MVTDKNEGANYKMDIKVISLVQEVEKEMDKIKNEPLKDAVGKSSEKKVRTIVVNAADVKGIREEEEVVVIKAGKHIPGERFNNNQKKEQSR